MMLSVSTKVSGLFLTTTILLVLAAPATPLDCLDYVAHMHWRGGLDTPGTCNGVAVSGNIAYLADGDAGLQVVDITYPASPRVIATFETLSEFQDLQVVGRYLYLAGGYGGLMVFDVAVPAQPVLLDYVDMLYAQGVEVVGDHAFLADGGNFRVADVSDPENLVLVATLDVEGTTRNVAVTGNLALVAAEATGLLVIDISNPNLPEQVGSFDTELGAKDVAAVGNIAYVGSGDLYVIDISVPEIPELITAIDAGDDYYGQVEVAGNFLYAARRNIMDVFDISTVTEPVLVGSQFTGGSVYDLFVDENYAYTTNGSDGFNIIDNPDTSPAEVIGALATVDRAVDVFVDGDIAYVADFLGGLRIIDVSSPGSPVEVGALSSKSATLEVVVREGIAYVADGYAGLRLVDVSVPALPTPIATAGTGGYYVSVDVSGDHAYLCDGTGLEVYDISTPETPEFLGSVDTPGYAVAATPAFGYVYVADDFAGMQIIDVSTPSSPVLVRSITLPGNVRELAIDGNHIYLATQHAGLQILDVSWPLAPIVVGSHVTPYDASGIAVSGGHAYVTSHDLVVFDVSTPAVPLLLGTLGVGDAYGRGIAVAGEYLFVAWADAGFKVANIACPGPLATTGDPPSVPSRLVLYPNPFNPRTTVEFKLARAGQVDLAVFDARGRKLAVLESGYLQQGDHRRSWSGRDWYGNRVSSGIYIVRLETVDGNWTHKAILLK